MKSILKKVITDILHKFGYEVHISKKGINQKPHFFNAPPSVHAFLQMVKNLGYYPTHIIDVGAHRGTWTVEMMEFFPNSTYTLFEPQEDLVRELHSRFSQCKNVSIVASGVGNAVGEMPFTLHTNDDCRSFLYDEQEANTLGYNQIKLPVTTIDSYMSANCITTKPDVLKIDAEGLDLEVLEGATQQLPNIELIFIEAGVNNTKYPNSVKDVINWLDLHGFRLFDITQTNRPFWPFSLWTTELVFTKKNGRFESGELLKKGGIIA